MAEKTQSSFLGIPIVGDIERHNPGVTQKPIEELAPLMQKLLDDPGIKSFAWRQYTPYFNDGETCYFNVYGSLNVVLAAGAVDDSKCPECDESRIDGAYRCYKCGEYFNDDDESDFDGVECNSALGKKERNYSAAEGEAEYKPYEGPDEARYDACLALEEALESGAFDSALLDMFGDHATVRVTKEKIEVETYEHD